MVKDLQPKKITRNTVMSLFNALWREMENSERHDRHSLGKQYMMIKTVVYNFRMYF